MKTLKIDPQSYASQGAAVLGIRDSGKSFTATKIAEELFDAGVPFVALDPIGLWRFLRVPGPGKGYPVVVAGGEEGDLPLTPGNAEAIARAAMQEGVSLVVDLFDMKLSKTDWRRIVQAVVKVLLFENKPHGLRHIFIEEAAEFCPQIIPKDGVSGEVYSVIERLARMGGNSRLGYTLINQRAEQVNKAVLELCDNLILHRQKGKNSLQSLEKWLSFGDAAMGKEVIASLPTLPTGEAWAWMAGAHVPTHVKIGPKHSFHPDRRVMRGDTEAAQKKRVDTGDFVANLKERLEKLAVPKAKPVNSIPKIAAPSQPGYTKADIDASEARGYARGFEAGRSGSIGILRVGVADYEKAMRQALAAPLAELRAALDRSAAITVPGASVPVAQRIEQRPSKPSVAGSSPAGHANGSGEAVDGRRIGKAERSILIALAQHGPCEKPRLAILAGYSANGGGFNNSLGALRSAGFVTRDATIAITSEGLAALGSYEPLPTGRALFEWWVQSPSLGKAERAILTASVDAGRAMTKDEIATAAGYEANGGGFNNALGRLRTLGLLAGRGEISPAEEFAG